MSKLVIPKNYKSKLGTYTTQTAIGDIKKWFEEDLKHALNLKRVSAPLFVAEKSGLNDDLSGLERPVSFGIPSLNYKGEVVHSLAKWKRMALYRYKFHIGNGLCTDMNAIRRDEVLSNIHSIYVDQWDWELVIDNSQRNINFLKETVRNIISAIIKTLDKIKAKYPNIDLEIDENISFITSQELEDLYPNLSPKEREHAYVKDHNTTFILQIGHKLKGGEPHDGRAPDYDDWDLNGDILFWHEPLQIAMELSSMGIRVNSQTLKEQLEISKANNRLEYEFHKAVINDILPLTIGGGIGQSRLCMLLLQKVHIGEVQVSLWDEDTLKKCDGKINLL
ncbi:MAG: aspartate--ammonia ligase [Clostridium sp.]|nr:aspartate--ammonia ligase [Clostridium sp.]